MKQKIVWLALGILFLAACNQTPKGLAESEVLTAQGSDGKAGEVKFRVETVASNLDVPWAIAFAPDGRIFFTERPGRVRVIENGKLRAEPFYKVADVDPSSESGLMDFSLHPDFAKNHFIYLAYTYRGEGKMMRVVRFKENGATLVEPKTIIESIAAAANHAGTRCRIGLDGKLYITTGDATDWNQAQKLDSLNGKTLRLNDDGSVPADNPFVGRKDARPEIWTYGHRNAQGLAWQPGSGLMFQTEHGPSGFEGKGGGGDEVNIVERGKNYGWAEIHHTERREGMESPLLEYSPSCAPASAAFYNGAAFPEFRGNFFFGCLRGQGLMRIVLDGRTVKSQEKLLDNQLGRIREVAAGPDGFIYFSTSNRDGRGSPAKDDDRIMRLIPVK